jgi:hypothetical protein
VRVGIHPGDIDHPLRADLIADLGRFRHFADYADAVPDDGAGPAGRQHRSDAARTTG